MEKSGRLSAEQKLEHKRKMNQTARARVINKHKIEIAPLNGSGDIKMSKIILDLAGIKQPSKTAIPSELIKFWISVWNMSLMHKDDLEIALNQTGTQLADARPFISAMMDKKNKLYPNNRRFIMDYEIFNEGDYFNLEIISADLPLEMVKPIHQKHLGDSK